MGIVENFKDVLKVADTLNNLELYKKLGELQTRVMEVEEENRTLREQLKATHEQNKITGELEVRNNAYWRANGGRIDGPFCMRCWDVDGRLVRERTGATEGTHFCTECATRRR